MTHIYSAWRGVGEEKVSRDNLKVKGRIRKSVGLVSTLSFLLLERLTSRDDDDHLHFIRECCCFNTEKEVHVQVAHFEQSHQQLKQN